MSEPDLGWVPDPANDFGARLALVRQHAGWTNIRLAASTCGVEPKSWRAWESKNRHPRDFATVCKAVSDACGVNLVWLMTGHVEISPGGLAPLTTTKPLWTVRTSHGTLRWHSDGLWTATPDSYWQAIIAQLREHSTEPGVAMTPVGPWWGYDEHPEQAVYGAAMLVGSDSQWQETGLTPNLKMDIPPGAVS